MIEIDKNVPIPEKRERKGKYPFPKMEVGDSFFTKSDGVKAALSRYSKAHGVDLISRKEGDGFRIWRKA